MTGKMSTILQYFFASLILFTAFIYRAEAVSSAGTEFYFTFQNNYRDSAELTLFITGEQDTAGVIEIPGLGFNEPFTVLANQVTTVVIPTAAQILPNLATAPLGIRVTSVNDVTVYGLNFQNYTTDAFLALPKSVLGTEYLVMSYDGLDWLSSEEVPSQIAIVGTEDGTQVTIVPRIDLSPTIQAGEPFTVTLNRNDVYQFRNVADLTGSFIRSTSPVAVMGSVNCADVPANLPYRVGWCDHLVEMMPPVTAWGRSFNTVPLATRLNGYILRVLAAENGTEVRINGELVATLERGTFHEAVINDFARIEATGPVLVAQYSAGQAFDNIPSDPFMAIIPANEQFLSQYTFATPETRFSPNYVNVVVPTDAIGSLQLNGANVDATLFSTIGGGAFSGAQLPIARGTHTMTADAPFSITVYGYFNYDSYGYPGGIDISRLNSIDDPFAPNIGEFRHVGYTLQGAATDSEDLNANGELDPGEDLNGNGVLDRRTEDVNDNGILDLGEDLNGNDFLDRDRGILNVELLAGADNLQIDSLQFLAGQTPLVNFIVRLVDNTLPGAGTVRVTDISGNTTDAQVSLPASAALTDLHVISTVSGDRIDVDQSTFSHPPNRVDVLPDRTIIEWHFETFLANQIQDLGYEVVLRDPQPGETREVTQKTELNYLDANEQRVITELGAQYAQVSASSFSITSGTDRTNYGPHEVVQLQANVSNLGTSSGNVSVELIIEDANGQPVTSFAPVDLTSITIGGSASVNETWDTGTTISGQYRLHAILRDNSARMAGAIAGESISPFSIITSTAGLPLSSVTQIVGYSSGGIFLQKQLYHTDDLVQIQNRVRNLSVNTLLSAVLQTTVLDPVGQEVFSEEMPLNMLLPGTVNDHLTSIQLTGALPGNYSIQSTLLDSETSAILATANNQFTVEINTGQSVIGSVSAEYTELLRGDDQNCTDTIHNINTYDLTGVTVGKSVIRIDTPEEVRTNLSIINLTSDQILVEPRVESTIGIVGEFACVLRVDEGSGVFNALGMSNIFNVYNLIANPGDDQTVFVAQTVQLDGTTSREADGNLLNYQWVILSRPAGSVASLSDPAAAQPTFYADEQGTYEVQLIVNNGTEDSLPKTMTVFVPNRVAVADAGPDQSVQVNDTATLDGSASFDVDGDPLAFNWQFVQKPTDSLAELSDPTLANPTFLIDVAGVYIAQLVVNDGIENSTPDTVLLNVGNVAPVAHAGDDLTGQLSDIITLDGSQSSDANGDLLSYRWQIIGRPTNSNARLTNNLTVRPEFTIDVAGEYVAQLIVNDGLASSLPDTVIVTVGEAPNVAPVANAGLDVPANLFQYITLDGTASSDLNGDLLGYRWNLLGRPNLSSATIENSFSANPRIYIDRSGDYIVQLIVNDSQVDSLPDTVIVRVGNVRPFANAYLDTFGELFTGDTVFLQGYGSDQNYEDVLTYSWIFSELPEGSTTILQNETTRFPSFVIDEPGDYVAQLTVNDGELDSEPDSVFVQGAQACVADMVIRPKSTKVQLNWTADLDTDAYIILRSTNINGPYVYVDETTADLPIYLDQGLTDGVTYYYRIQRLLPPGGRGWFCDSYYYGSYGGECELECFSQTLAAMPNYRVRMARVPDLYGMSPEVATETLTTKYLDIGTVTSQRTTAVPPGQIISQDPPRESVIPRGTTVNIIISTR